jgi:catechol 2,3-dioxygenase-like lactoylglutathione lyase family enzyme
MAGIIETNIVTQVGFIVRDVVKTKKKFAEFLGLPEPQHFDCGDFKITQTQYCGKSAPDANCILAFFDVGPNMQIELIQPNGARSTWQDYLDEHGEGIHHIAFVVKNMDEKIASCEKFGMKLVQRAKYRGNDGGYAYMEAYDSLKCIVELLESY